VQRLKDDIRENILKTALGEFADKGFEKASMREIALKAGITVGNMYRYFENKSQLFSSIVGPVYNKLVDLIVTYDPVACQQPGSVTSLEDEVADLVTRVYAEHKTVLLILLDKSSGSDYKNAKEKLILLLQERIRTSLLPQINQHATVIGDPIFPRIMAIGFWEGLIAILKECEDIERIKKLTQQFTQLYFKDILRRFDGNSCPDNDESE